MKRPARPIEQHGANTRPGPTAIAAARRDALTREGEWLASALREGPRGARRAALAEHRQGVLPEHAAVAAEVLAHLDRKIAGAKLARDARAWHRAEQDTGDERDVLDVYRHRHHLSNVAIAEIVTRRRHEKAAKGEWREDHAPIPISRKTVARILRKHGLRE